jgi:hypothetical protein
VLRYLDHHSAYAAIATGLVLMVAALLGAPGGPLASAALQRAPRPPRPAPPSPPSSPPSPHRLRRRPPSRVALWPPAALPARFCHFLPPFGQIRPDWVGTGHKRLYNESGIAVQSGNQPLLAANGRRSMTTTQSPKPKRRNLLVTVGGGLIGLCLLYLAGPAVINGVEQSGLALEDICAHFSL